LSLPDAGSHTLSLVGSLPDVVCAIPRRGIVAACPVG
jgi:hypothetical protein